MFKFYQVGQEDAQDPQFAYEDQRNFHSDHGGQDRNVCVRSDGL